MNGIEKDNEKDFVVPPENDKPLFTIANFEIALNTVNHGMIAIITFYVTWYCIKSGLSGNDGHTAQHTILSMIGYQLLMAEGIMVMYKGNSYTFNVQNRQRQGTIHWILLAAGSIFAIAGTLVEYVWRAERNHHSFLQAAHRHTLWGIVSIFLIIPTVFSGITSLFPLPLKRFLKPLLSKFSHNVIATACFLVGTVSSVMAFKNERWFRTHDPDNLYMTMTWLTSISACIAMIGPVKTFYKQIRAFMGR